MQGTMCVFVGVCATVLCCAVLCCVQGGGGSSQGGPSSSSSSECSAIAGCSKLQALLIKLREVEAANTQVGTSVGGGPSD